MYDIKEPMNPESNPFAFAQSNFISQGLRCDGRLYLPAESEKPPVVIMAHGFAAQMDFGLFPFARRFLTQGLAVFMFDYRCFGKSEGTPKNLVSPARHVADWQAATRHVKALSSIDPSRLFLWGSSFSGGHALVTAAKEPGISGVIAQIPFIDGPSTIRKVGMKNALMGAIAGMRDVFRLLTFRAPYTIPVIGKPDTFAALNTPEAYPGYKRLIPEESDWQNACPARICLTLPLYRPGIEARKATCPVLIIGASEDSLIDMDMIRKRAAKIPDCRLEILECGHFDVYAGPMFEANVSLQEAFLKKHLQ